MTGPGQGQQGHVGGRRPASWFLGAHSLAGIGGGRQRAGSVNCRFMPCSDQSWLCLPRHFFFLLSLFCVLQSVVEPIRTVESDVSRRSFTCEFQFIHLQNGDTEPPFLEAGGEDWMGT